MVVLAYDSATVSVLKNFFLPEMGPFISIMSTHVTGSDIHMTVFAVSAGVERAQVVYN